jgi:hypothetical protein
VANHSALLRVGRPHPGKGEPAQCKNTMGPVSRRQIRLGARVCQANFPATQRPAHHFATLLGSFWSSRKELVRQCIGLPFEAGLCSIAAVVQVPPKRPGVPDRCHEHAGDEPDQGKTEAERDEPRHLPLRPRRGRPRSLNDRGGTWRRRLIQDATFSFGLAAATVSMRPFTTAPSATATRGAARSPWRSAPF